MALGYYSTQYDPRIALASMQIKAYERAEAKARPMQILSAVGTIAGNLSNAYLKKRELTLQEKAQEDLRQYREDSIGQQEADRQYKYDALEADAPVKEAQIAQANAAAAASTEQANRLRAQNADDLIKRNMRDQLMADLKAGKTPSKESMLAYQLAMTDGSNANMLGSLQSRLEQSEWNDPKNSSGSFKGDARSIEVNESDLPAILGDPKLAGYNIRVIRNK